MSVRVWEGMDARCFHPPGLVPSVSTVDTRVGCIFLCVCVCLVLYIAYTSPKPKPQNRAGTVVIEIHSLPCLLEGGWRKTNRYANVAPRATNLSARCHTNTHTYTEGVKSVIVHNK